MSPGSIPSILDTQHTVWNPKFKRCGSPRSHPPGFLDQQVPSLRNLAFFLVSPSPVTSIPLQHQWTDSFVVIRELLVLLASAPLLEVVILEFEGGSTLGAEPLKVVTLSKLRKLVWTIGLRFSLIPFLIAPELSDLEIRLKCPFPGSDPFDILPPQRGHFPLLVDPTALRCVYHNNTRTWHFTYESGHLTISGSPDL